MKTSVAFVRRGIERYRTDQKSRSSYDSLVAQVTIVFRLDRLLFERLASHPQFSRTSKIRPPQG